MCEEMLSKFQKTPTIFQHITVVNKKYTELDVISKFTAIHQIPNDAQVGKISLPHDHQYILKAIQVQYDKCTLYKTSPDLCTKQEG